MTLNEYYPKMCDDAQQWRRGGVGALLWWVYAVFSNWRYPNGRRDREHTNEARTVVSLNVWSSPIWWIMWTFRSARKMMLRFDLPRFNQDISFLATMIQFARFPKILLLLCHFWCRPYPHDGRSNGLEGWIALLINDDCLWYYFFLWPVNLGYHRYLLSQLDR